MRDLRRKSAQDKERERLRRKYKKPVGYTLVQDHRYENYTTDIQWALSVEVTPVFVYTKPGIERFGGVIFERKSDAEVFAAMVVGEGKIPKVHGRFPGKYLATKYGKQRLYVPTNKERDLAGLPLIETELPTSAFETEYSGKRNFAAKDGGFNNDTGTYELGKRCVGSVERETESAGIS